MIVGLVSLLGFCLHLRFWQGVQLIPDMTDSHGITRVAAKAIGTACPVDVRALMHGFHRGIGQSAGTDLVDGRGWWFV